MSRIKWVINDGISFNRGNWDMLIAKFDNSKKWLMPSALCTASTFRAEIRQLAQDFGAKVVEVKKLFQEGKPVEKRQDVVDFLKLSSGYIFRIEKSVPEGARREFIEFTPDEIFIKE